MKFSRRNRWLPDLLIAVLIFALGGGAARAVDYATVELTLIWGTDDEQTPDPTLKPVGPNVEKLLASSPYRWKHYFEVNRRVEDIESDRSKDKIAMSSHCEMDIKYLGRNRVQVKLYGDKKLLSTQRVAMPVLLAGDARNNTAWLVLIRLAQPKGAQAGAGAALVEPAEAQTIEDEFRPAYSKLGNPRILVFVNRNLVNSTSGLRLSARNEQVETTSSTVSGTNTVVTTHSVANNVYSDNGTDASSLADRQTVRDVERLMGRPFRDVGATLVDQGIAAQLIGDRPLEGLTAENDQARKDREAVGKIADVAVEVLISSRQVSVPELTGGYRNYNIPDIQATAVRLSDSKIIGQASSADVIRKAGNPAYAARNYTVEAITEATAFALMDDIAAGAK